jgi:hypothetical protein
MTCRSASLPPVGAARCSRNRIIHDSPRCRAGVQLVRSATTTPHPTFSVAARRCAGRARRRPYTAGTPVTNFRQQERPAQMTVEKAFARAAGSEPAGRSDLKALLASFPPKEMTCWPVSGRLWGRCDHFGSRHDGFLRFATKTDLLCHCRTPLRIGRRSDRVIRWQLPAAAILRRFKPMSDAEMPRSTRPRYPHSRQTTCSCCTDRRIGSGRGH